MNLIGYNRRRLFQKAVITVASMLAFLLLWHLGSLVVTRNLPAPLATFELAAELLQEPGPRLNTGFDHLRISLVRVGIVLGASILLSIVIGVLMGVSATIEKVVSMWLPLWMTAPDVVVILIVMIILGFEGQAIIIAVIFTATPFGIVNIWSGIQDLDNNLLEMARAHDSSNRLVWQYIYVPHLMSYIFASTRYMIGLAWKVVLVGEAFGTTDGMGAIIRYWFNQGDVGPVLAYLMLFVVVMLFIEYGIFKTLERRLFDWRESV